MVPTRQELVETRSATRQLLVEKRQELDTVVALIEADERSGQLHGRDWFKVQLLKKVGLKAEVTRIEHHLNFIRLELKRRDREEVEKSEQDRREFRRQLSIEQTRRQELKTERTTGFGEHFIEVACEMLEPELFKRIRKEAAERNKEPR